VIAGRDPLLRTGDAPAGARLRRGRAQRRWIATGLRLGQRERAREQLARREARVPLLLLLGRAVAPDQLAHHVGHADRDRDRRIAARELLHDERVRDDAGVRAAELFGERDREQAELAELAQLLRGKLAGGIALGSL